MIFTTQDGSHSIQSEQFGVSYHSKYGAIQETHHVFINAALRMKAIVQSEISILEIGFGTGLNAYMTWLEGNRQHLTINYTGVEAYPIALDTAQSLNYTELLKVSPDNDVFLKMHHQPWNTEEAITENFKFKKLNCQFQELVAHNEFDIIYFDAFAPTAQPELWEHAIFEIMYNALKPSGVLTTYCAKGVVKRTMKAVGFKVEKLPGPPGKREMTRAIKPD